MQRMAEARKFMSRISASSNYEMATTKEQLNLRDVAVAQQREELRSQQGFWRSYKGC